MWHVFWGCTGMYHCNDINNVDSRLAFPISKRTDTVSFTFLDDDTQEPFDSQYSRQFCTPEIPWYSLANWSSKSWMEDLGKCQQQCSKIYRVERHFTRHVSPSGIFSCAFKSRKLKSPFSRSVNSISSWHCKEFGDAYSLTITVGAFL